MNKEETLAMIRGFLIVTLLMLRVTDGENDDILVEHMVIAFPDNTKELFWRHTPKDGKFIQCETGATKIG